MTVVNIWSVWAMLLMVVEVAELQYQWWYWHNAYFVKEFLVFNTGAQFEVFC